MKRHRIFSKGLSKIPVCYPERIFFAKSAAGAKKARLAVLLNRFLLNDRWGVRIDSKPKTQR